MPEEKQPNIDASMKKKSSTLNNSQFDRVRKCIVLLEVYYVFRKDQSFERVPNHLNHTNEQHPLFETIIQTTTRMNSTREANTHEKVRHFHVI